MANLFVILLLSVVSLYCVCGQENTQTRVAQSLQECYNTTEYKIKDYRLPTTLNSLLDLIRKVENGPDKMDLRMLAVNLLQRFRQDGIIKANVNLENLPGTGLPYSPKGTQNSKFKMILKYMTPGNAMQFPNDTLTANERCSLHSMLSSSIDDRRRSAADESVCQRLGQYQRRVSRAINPNDEVEVLDNNMLSQKGYIKQDPKSQVDSVPKIKTKTARMEEKSDCPIENGVIYTKWGSIAAGQLLAGIAAGAQPQYVSVRTLADGVLQNTKIDNLWGATIAGDLAEAALYKDEEDNAPPRPGIGADGGWNSTLVPRWYFLKKNTQLSITDAEIRGDIDGFVLGSLYKNSLKDKVSSLKLSQLIDMYYSSKGLSGGDYKACRRNLIYKQFMNSDTMAEQTTAFAIALDKQVTLRYSLSELSIAKLATAAAEVLDEYVAQQLSKEVNCDAYSGEDQTIATDIMIILDCQWPFENIYPTLSYLLNNLDISTYNSNFTLINAQDGSLIVNTTNTVNDFHSAFNTTTYDKLQKGFNLMLSVRTAENIAKRMMNNEKNMQPGGRSMIALLVPYNEQIDSSQMSYTTEIIRDYINVFTPDLRFMVLTKGNKEIFKNIVKDTTKDVATMNPTTDGTMIMNAISPLIQTIKTVPRRFTNSKCGSAWSSDGPDKVLEQNIEPSNINFYRVHPNYFFGEASKSIKVRGLGYNPLTVCYSRIDIQPRANQSTSSASDVTCKKITSDEYVIDLTNACKDKTFIHDCQPLYISIEAPKLPDSIDSIQFNCINDDSCRFPYNTKYTIRGENLPCASTANILITNLFVIIAISSTVLVKIYAH